MIAQSKRLHSLLRCCQPRGENRRYPDPVIRGLLLCATGLLLAFGAGPAQAAFPGKPGPIAYSKVSTDEVDEGRVESVGGLFAHGPRIKEPRRRLTTDTGDDSPSYSADGRLIVFASDEEATLRHSIYVMRSDGSERSEVTVDGLGGTDPAFFPSGRAIAFVHPVDGNRQIFTIRLDGSGLRQLTHGPHDNYEPAVSPNGRRIAFASERDRDGRHDRSDIFTMRADGSHVRAAIDGPRKESEPDWAPDGRRLAFIVSGGLRSDIFLASADGTDVKRLTACRAYRRRCRNFHHPVFSPDGRHIAVHSSGTRTSGIEVLRGDGSSLGAFDFASIEEEGFGSTLGPPTWGPQPR
jgi:Tol biopolymer transport system component